MLNAHAVEFFAAAAKDTSTGFGVPIGHKTSDAGKVSLVYANVKLGSEFKGDRSLVGLLKYLGGLDKGQVIALSIPKQETVEGLTIKLSPSYRPDKLAEVISNYFTALAEVQERLSCDVKEAVQRFGEKDTPVAPPAKPVKPSKKASKTEPEPIPVVATV